MATTEQSVPSGRRTTAFRIVAGIFGFATIAAIVPFEVISFTNAADAIHRMHNTSALVTFGTLLGAMLVVCAWRPGCVVAFRVVVASAVIAAIAGAVSGDVFTSGSFIGVVPVAILWVLHPLRERVLTFGRIRVEPAVLAVAAFVPATAWAMTQSNLQRHGVPALDPHAAAHHYSSMAQVGLTLAAAALVASFSGAGRRFVARVVGVVWTAMGVVSLGLHDHVGAFATLWSWALVIGGLLFIALSEASERREPVIAASPAGAPA
jgi:hypothetical protein